MAAVSAVLSALGTLLLWVLSAVGILLGILLFLLLIVLFVPAFAEVRYDEDEWFVVVGMACVRVHVYPYFYFIWDRYANESEEEREARLLAKKAKADAKRAAKQAEKDAKKEVGKAKKKGPKITLDVIVTLVQTAGMVMRLLLGAVRVKNICIRLPVHAEDAAQTAILYGKTNAWLYSGLAVLNNFLYLDFKEVQISPIFEENFERSAYFSCKVSAQLFIIVVIAFRLLQILRKEKEVLAILLRRTPRSVAK